jgi:hypothetical protein
MEVTITYKQISGDLQKIKMENICKIVANALKRNTSGDNKSHIETNRQYYGKEEMLN